MTAVGTRIRFLPSLSHRFGGPIVRTAGRLESALQLQILKESGPHAAIPRALVLRGPGDVVAMRPGAIARVEPPPGSHDFEPNYFPFVEFRDPDFPWRYSLDPDTDPLRRRPWLVLLVLSGSERARLEDVDGLRVIEPVANGREILRVTGDLLPDLDSSWAWAHVHLNRYDGASVADVLSGGPNRICSRLVCCRRLEPRTRYSAFLVPAWRAGIDALSPTPAEPTFDPAWTDPPPEAVLELPIYFRWEFMTSEGGDFESLARALAPASVSGLPIGTRAVDAARMRLPGVVGPPIHLLREGALSVPGFAATRASYDVASRPLPLTGRLTASLDASLANDVDSDDEDPLVTFPVYGSHYRRVASVQAPAPDGSWPTPAPWLHELNLDFRNRIAAGLGAEVVRRHQHEYVKECWRQVGKLRLANERLRLSAAGLRVGLAQDAKHVQPLDDDRFALLTVPYHTHVATEARGSGTSYAKAFADSGLARGVLSQAFKRLAHRAIGIGRIRPFDPYRRTCERPCFEKPPRREPDKQASAVLSELLGVGLEAAFVPAKAEVVPVTPVDVGADFRGRFDLHAAMLASLTAVIRFNDGRTVSDRLDPIVAGPVLEQPMYEPLSGISLDHLLPGIEFLPNNGVTLMVENRRFIESYMAGVNHELVNELVWRRYPVHRAFTICRRFWESTASPDPIPDIEYLERWRHPLGENPASGAEASLVLVIKGDLIRRYPGTIVYAMRVDSRRGGRFEYWREAYPDEPPPMEPPTLVEPVFRAQVGVDIQFVGFPLTVDDVRGPTRDGEYYFVLQENQDLPRFGLDVQSAGQRRPELCASGPPAADDLGWAHVADTLRAGYIDAFAPALFAGGGGVVTSASIASRTYQQPVRVAIHASHMLDGG